MKHTTYFLLLFLLGVVSITTAQQIIAPPIPSDTMRVILIKQARSLREKNIDSLTNIKTGAGDVIIVEGKTTTNCDSVVYNQRTNILEAFGNIHINDNDSIHTYSQYLRYIGLDRIAYLKKNVRLTDKKGTLYTDDLEYNLRTGVATYKNGGRVVNGNTILTSKEGVYYADTKDIYFIEALKDYVVINTIDTRYTIHSTMKEIEVKMGSTDFLRIQRSFIVRLDKIATIEFPNLNL